ncbi:MAG TPA: helix-turn-helix domain-containing protein [Paucimonas sp.]|nr:helix-turn-helix domain-containing protein [Paucimonas sp.]
MAAVQTTESAEIVPLRTPKARNQASEKKWGKAVIDLGFSIIPSLIFRAQARLGLNPTQLAVLLQLADYWWDEQRHPYPAKETLAERLGLSARQVQRYVAELEVAGLVKRIERYASHKGRLSNQYDLTGLVERLKKLEPEFREVDKLKRQVGRRGGLKSQKEDGK